ncbi:helix-turn-helix domain-containing protein [Nostoc sp. CHAB 5824]|nr:helix-turn-helix domain-containing protein [Nostoc sp. CHAB 5824]
MPDRFLQPAELAKELKIPLSNLAKWRLHGGGPVFLKLGKNVRYEWSEVERWLESRKQRTTSDTA